MGEPGTVMLQKRNEARKRILEALDKAPGREIYSVEAAEIARCSTARARNYLNHLEEDGLLVSRFVPANAIEGTASGLGRRYFKRAGVAGG